MTTNPEFDLAIHALDQGGYTVSLRAASGVDLPPEPLQIALQLPALPEYRDIARFVAAAREVRLGADADLRDAKRVGGALFNALFPREVLSRFRAARDALPFDGRLLVRLRLPPAMMAIPWELLYDSTNDQFLALADDLALVRCPELAAPLRPLQLTGPLQVVVVLASPRGVRAIDLDRERGRVEAALRGPVAEGRVELQVIRGPGTLEQLRRQLARPIHVLHILCHGDLDERRGEGVLLFEDPSGDKEQISAVQLRLLIEKQRGQTRLVVLNSCMGAVSGGNDPFGSVGAALMRAGVPAVVAMQFEIPAESAQELARIFYTDLADGRPIDSALTEARRHLFGYDSLRLDWAIPALFLRGNDGALFSAAAASALHTPPPTGVSPPVQGQAPAPAPPRGAESEMARLEELRHVQQQRLHELELRTSRFGTLTPTEVTIEIQDIELELVRASDTLATLQTTTEADRTGAPEKVRAEIRRIAAAFAALQSRIDDVHTALVSKQPPPARLSDPVLTPTELRSLRQRANAAFFVRRWAEAEPLLAQLAAADAKDSDAQARLHLLRGYRNASERRAAGEWDAVLKALDDLAHQPGFADPERHRAWAEAQQRRDAAYTAALDAYTRSDWAAAQAALEPLLAEQPDDEDAAALLQRAREELVEEQRLAEATAARKQAEEERQHRAAESAARQQAEEERQRKIADAAAARARAIDPIITNLSKQSYDVALGQLEALLKADPKDGEAIALAAKLIENPAVPLVERLRAGDVAGQYGDPRPGVVSLPPAMVAFVGGRFLIGNTQAEHQAIIEAEKRNNLEKEAANWYKDTVSTQTMNVAPFELARYPVTNAQWALFVAADGYKSDQPWWNTAGRAWRQQNRRTEPSFWDDDRFGKAHRNYPVVGINWYEAVAFCCWLTQHLDDGFTYALPNELEWEYAARGAVRRVYAWGDQAPDGERANFNQTHHGTTAVGCFPVGATPDKLLDMTGTVWEWTRSEYRAYPYDPTDGREQGDDPAKKRFAVRGGGWRYRPIFLRASRRRDLTPVNRYDDVGLRLARHRR